MVTQRTFDPHHGFSKPPEPRRKPSTREAHVKRTYTVRLTSDDWTSECQFELTDYQRQLLLEIAKGFNEQARFSVDHRVFIQSAAPTGDVA